MQWTCNSSAPANSKSTKPAKCMKDIKKHKKHCQNFVDGNQFCAKFKEDINDFNNTKPSGGKIWFNKQERHVPVYVSDFLKEDNVTQDCGIYCKELDGMVTFETPSSLIPGIGLVTNSIVSYSALDNMCATCA